MEEICFWSVLCSLQVCVDDTGGGEVREEAGGGATEDLSTPDRQMRDRSEMTHLVH